MAPCQVCARPSESRCSKCKMANYCSSACQKSTWSTHKLLCTRLSKTSPVDLGSSTCLPVVVLMGIMDCIGANIYQLQQDFFVELYRRTAVVFACSPQVSLAALDLNPQAVVVVDHGIVTPGWNAVLTRVIRQTKGYGCRLVLGGLSPGMGPGLDHAFRSLGVPWRFKDYFRTDFELSPMCTAPLTPGLATSFSMKATHIDNVRPSDALYVPPPDAKLQSAVYLQETLYDKAGCGAAYMKYGSGWLGYHGDANAEGASTKSQLAMCGLDLTDCTLDFQAPSDPPRLFLNGTNDRLLAGSDKAGVKIGNLKIPYVRADGSSDPNHSTMGTDIDFWFRPAWRVSNDTTARYSRWDPNRPLQT